MIFVAEKALQQKYPPPSYQLTHTPTAFYSIQLWLPCRHFYQLAATNKRPTSPILTMPKMLNSVKTGGIQRRIILISEVFNHSSDNRNTPFIHNTHVPMAF